MKECGTFQAQYKIWVYAKNIRCTSGSGGRCARGDKSASYQN
jgi:hypothetical protein